MSHPCYSELNIADGDALRKRSLPQCIIDSGALTGRLHAALRRLRADNNPRAPVTRPGAFVSSRVQTTTLNPDRF